MSDKTLTPEENALEGARAYFGPGRCSGHAQFNGRHCRVSAGPEQWCIHCAGNMLVAAITAAHERESACAPYLKDGETPSKCIERNRKDIDATLSLLAADRAALAEAQRENTRLLAHGAAMLGKVLAYDDLQRNVTKLREYVEDEIATPPDDRKTELGQHGALVLRLLRQRMDTLGLTTQPPQDAEPAT